MQDPGGVRGVQRSPDSPQDLQDARQGQHGVLGKQGVQILALQEFHRQDGRAVVIPIETPDLHDVGMVKLGDDLGFVDKAEIGAFVHRRELMHQLDRTDPVAHLIDGPIYGTHGATAQHLLDPIAVGEHPTDGVSVLGDGHDF
jgi:hypothetical protein